MSDPLHLDRIRAGALVWNDWRRDNPGIVPDLNGLRISASEIQFGAVQGGPIDFSRTELAQATLAHATLIEANLAGAVLTKADLSYGRLNKADLRGADLRGAKLAYADLTGVRLDGAFVCGADLRHARGLTQQQIDRAFGGERTLLPGDLEIPSTWLAEDERARQRGGSHDADALTKAYDLLGVKPKASMQEIRVAWLRLVKELHPDIAADDPASCERLKVINRAYQGLKSLEQREMAWRAQRRANSMARATFVVFLLLPVAAALAVGAWTYGVKGPIHQSVAALLDLAGPGRPDIEGTSGQVQDAEEKPTVVARADLEGLPARQGEVGSLPDAASDDDAAWARAAAEATSVSLHRYLGRFPHGRYAQKAMDELTQVASVEVALAKDFRSRDAAGIQQAAPMLRRYLADYPTGQLANEARGKLAAIEAGGGADVAWSDAEQRDGKRALAENVNAHAVEMTGASGHRVLALAEPAGRDRIASSDTQRGNGQASLGTYLELRSDGRHVDTEAAGVAELDGIPEARSATAAGIKTPKQALRTARPVAHATQQWRSASEPFVAADGRIR